MTNLKIILFDDSNGWDNDILRWEILDVKDHPFLCSVMPNINILYIPILSNLKENNNEHNSTSKIIIFDVIYYWTPKIIISCILYHKRYTFDTFPICQRGNSYTWRGATSKIVMFNVLYYWMQ